MIPQKPSATNPTLFGPIGDIQGELSILYQFWIAGSSIRLIATPSKGWRRPWKTVPLNLARKQGLLPNNPAEALEMVTADGLEKGVFTPEQISRLLAVATREWKGLIWGGFYTGSRAGDLPPKN